MVIFIHIYLCRKSMGQQNNVCQKNNMQPNHRSLCIHRPEKVSAKQVNFVFSHLHSNCIESKCGSA